MQVVKGASLSKEASMDHFEMVEKLRSKVNVSYEEAKAALEASDWDLLDALVYLENRGKVSGEEASYTTRQEPHPEASPQSGGQQVKGVMERLLSSLRDLIHKGNKTMMDISFRGKSYLELPMTLVVPLLVLGFPAVPLIVLVGMFLGLRYSFRGENISDSMNKAMDKAYETVDSIKSGVQDKSKE